LFHFGGGPGEHPVQHGLLRVGQLDRLARCESLKLLLLYGRELVEFLRKPPFEVGRRETEGVEKPLVETGLRGD